MSRLRVITFKADDEFIERVHRFMKLTGVENRSDLIRQAIMKIISSIDDGNAIVCIELSSEELLYLRLLSKDPVVALKKLLRQNMVHSSWLSLAKGVVER